MNPYTDFSMIKPDVLHYASERGSHVHAIICAMLQNKWIPKKSITEDIRGYIHSFKHFQKLIKEMVFVEKTFISEVYGLTGTIDFGGYLIDRPDWFTVLDWKTPLLKQPTWKGQLSAYNTLAKKFKPKRIGSLQLNPNGGPGKMTWYEDSAEAWEAYLCALTALRYFGGK
jgi:hypothetical protein